MRGTSDMPSDVCIQGCVATQGQPPVVRWADASNRSAIRPVITYCSLALYCAAKTAAFTAAVTAGTELGRSRKSCARSDGGRSGAVEPGS